MTRIIESFAEIAAQYDALYCDLWGCYHNGLTPYPAAVAALRAFRETGGKVILMTNAPRPRDAVIAHLRAMGAPDDSYDALVSSGDAARNEVASGRMGRRVEHVGPARDLPFFDGLDVARVGRDEAESVVITGLYDDETETPDDYAEAIAAWRARGLTALCANPDIIVDRGDERLYCAGAIAEAYAAAGGEVIVTGKPHPPIYRLAEELRRELGAGDRVLALGDGIATDIAGGAAEGIDTLLVTGGLLAERFGPDPEAPDPALLRAWLPEAPATPTYAIGRLR
jgi:HAD superfamily hydrolase (TIGR01459 family)